MSTTATAAAATVPVTVHVPAGDARVVGDFLIMDAPEAKEAGAPDGMPEAMERIGRALHGIGWQDDALAAAETVRKSDEFLDAPGPVVHLPADLADALLIARGWKVEEHRTGAGAPYVVFVVPGRSGRHANGKAGTDYLWNRDEALALALTAEGLAAQGI